MRGNRQIRSLERAGTAMIAAGVVEVISVCGFAGRGGWEGLLSPVAAVAVGWPVAVLMVYFGLRLRFTASELRALSS